MSGKSYSARTVPVLHALLCDLGAKATARGAMPGDVQIVRLAQEELHLVLAVVKAARRRVDDYYDALPLGADTDPLVKALARLKKARRA